MTIIKKAFLLCLSIIIIIPVFAGCKADTPEYRDERDDQYIVLVFTNTHYEAVESYAAEMKVLFGSIDPDNSNRMYAAGYIGPMLLTQSIEQMQQQINEAFDMAEKHDIPVYFQVDDVNNYTTLLGDGAQIKYYEDASMCEWIAFPEEGEEYGGQNAYGALPRFWYNWGSWRVAKPFPNLASPKLKELVVNNLKEGVLAPLMERYTKLIKEDKAYLFAGLCLGWETHIPDYSSNNKMLNVNVNQLPADYATGVKMQEWELAQYGYSALHTLGYDQQKIAAEAEQKGRTAEQHTKELLFEVIHDYTELLCKTAYEAGIPRHKIYSHTVGVRTVMNNDCTFYPQIWTAVNDYSTPGFTMSPVTCKYDFNLMKEQILQADADMQEFALAEGYAAGFDTVEKADAYFKQMFENGARVVTCFGYPDVGVPVFEFRRESTFPYIISSNKWLNREV